MTSFTDYLKKVEKALKKGVTTRTKFKKMTRWCGNALRDFIENNDTFKPAETGKDAGKGTKDNAKSAQNLISKLYADDASITTTVPAKDLGDMAQVFLNKAATEEAKAKAAVTATDPEEASEAYVNAAINNFRAALCFYAQGGFSNPTPDYSDQTVLNASLNYALTMMKAAKDLADAADNEDSEDVSEIMAELMVSANFYGAAETALENLEAGANKKGVTLDKKTKDLIKDSKDTCTTEQSNSKAGLDSHLK